MLNSSERNLLLDREFAIESLRSSTPLDLRNIGDSAWKAILANCRTEELHLHNLKVQSLSGIENLRSVRLLNIVWAAKVDTLEPVFRMNWLERLSLSDFKVLRKIEGIESLENLRELHLSGNLGSLVPPLRLKSIRPIAKLAQLESLELQNIRLEDDDISFVGDSFPRLRNLTLSSRFERRQLAYIARRLNRQLAEPIEPSFPTNLPCNKCGKMRHMFVGRRMPILCDACDSSRSRKLIEEFQKMAQES